MHRASGSGDLRRWAVWGGKLLIAALLLFLLVQNVNSNTLLPTLTGAQPLFLVGAVLLLIPNLLFQYRKWALLLRSVHPAVRPHDIGASLMLGFTFGVVTPARIGEFGGRAFAVRGTDRLALIGLTAVDKLATLTVTVMAGSVGLLIFCIQHPFIDPALLAAAELTVLSFVAGLSLLWTRRKRSASVIPPARWLQQRIQRIQSALAGVDTRLRVRLLLLSLLFYCTFLLQFVLLLYAFGSTDLLSALAGISTIMLIKTVIPPVTVGELGIREGASVYVLGHAGIVAAAAFSASLLLFAINILLPSLAGLLILFRRSTAHHPA